MPAPGSAAARRVLPVWAGLLLAVFAGLLMPLQGRVNGGLSTAMDDGAGAATVSFATGLIVMTVLSFALPAGRRGLAQARAALRDRDFPRWYLLAGVLGAYLVLGQASAVPLIGVAVFTVAVVAGQTISGLVVDRIGFGPGGRRAVTARRLTAAVVMVLAVAWAVSPRMAPGSDGDPGPLLPVLLPFTAGLLMGFQQAMNGTQAARYGTPITATLFNFAAGALVLATAWAVKVLVGGGTASWPGEWWLYTGGLFGCIFIAIGAVLVRSLGVLVSGLCMIAGQLVGSLAIDLVLPAPGTIIAPATVLGTLVTLGAVVLASLPGRRPR
ncbi:DMT family transporter [Zafaria sp. J156]|uniref:DMT family transporter n=1 Tax=Zafaria sp. J156 TaxID=3116490 RepID=UPI002E794A0A|nr:DMT family transporter [Zafaria sp. J156]MEE1620043.1 DMT family transporter [Zafaria sp. J156]